MDVLIKEWEWPPIKAIEMEPVEGFTSIRLKLEPGFKAFRHEATIPVSDVFDVFGSSVFDDEDGEHGERGILYFVDQFPEANWPHLCVYVIEEVRRPVGWAGVSVVVP